MAAAGAGRAARMHFPLLRVGARWLFWREYCVRELDQPRTERAAW